MSKQVEHVFREESFSCPICGVFAAHDWSVLYFSKGSVHLEESEEFTGFGYHRASWDPISGYDVSKCYACRNIALWHDSKLIYPSVRIGPDPNSDLSAEIRVDFEEARAIAQASPRGAATLLRLAVQKLCKQLGEPGKNINTDIASLVEKGLNRRVQQMLDIVRVTGNNAVHPGEMDIRDNRELVVILFGLINQIADQLITQPRNLDELYAQLPQSALEGIDKRDKK